MRRTLPSLMVAVLVLGAACATSSASKASSGASVPPGGPGVRTVTVTLDDAGRTITVVEGQTLVFQVSDSASPRPPSYRVASFPPFLTPKSDLAKTPFTFLVAHAGRGDLVILESPCPPIQADAATACPLAGPPGAPIQQITFSIVAQGRGI